MVRKKYDQLLVECIGNRHIKEGTVYYDDEYAKTLIDFLKRDNLLEKFKLELNPNSKGIKMCSIGSSSRFCYLSSKGLYKEIDTLEKTDLMYNCCNPHYDGYSESSNTFYEFKSHELCDKTHQDLSFSYVPLLKEVFNITTNDPSNLHFLDFGLKLKDNPSIYKINFDFKQFICHFLGLLSHVKKTNRRTKLLYVWVVPNMVFNDKDNRKLKKFVDMIDRQINLIFEQFKELEINYFGEKKRINDIIEFGLEIINSNDIKDFVYEKLVNKEE